MTDLAEPDRVIADRLRPPEAPDPDDLIHETVDPDTGDIIRAYAVDDAPWEIDGRRTAEWAVAKIRAAHAEFADTTAPAREAIAALRYRADELQEFIDAQGARRDRTVDFFESKLTGWLRRLRRKDLDDGIDPDKATKSIKLAGGTVWSRAGTDRIDVTDPEAVSEWATSAYGDDVAFVRHELRVDKSNVWAHIKETGEIPPGVAVKRATEEDRPDGVRLT